MAYPKSKNGRTLVRPAALTPEVQADIIRFLTNGSYFGPACVAAGTTPETVKYWLRLYEDGAEHAQGYADFFASLKRAVAFAEQRALDAVQDGAPSWQSRAWFLERRFPDRWAVAKDRPEKTDSVSRREVVREAQERAEKRKRDRRAGRPAE